MELDQGAIEIDGVQIANLGLAQLRNAMAIIPQVLLSNLLLMYIEHCWTTLAA